MSRKHFIALAFAALLAMQACGQTGELYWPEDEKTAVDEDQADAEG